MRARVRAYCLRHDLLVPGALVIGVSGGADSLTLLHLLHRLRAEFQLALHVATFDHRLRGAESAADAEFVRAIAEKWDIPVTVGGGDVAALAAAQHIGIEAAARSARYAFLRDVARTVGAAQIAVGHNRDDQAETVLMHVLRGTGLAGLRGILPLSDLEDRQVIRPLLATPRAAIDAYAAEYDLHPRTDATNADTHYLRNRLRHDVLPSLRAINPAVDEALAQTAETARADYDHLLASLNFPADTDRIGREAFAALSLSAQRMLIREMARRLIREVPPFLGVEDAIDWIGSARPGESMRMPDGLIVRLSFDAIHFAAETSDGASAALFDAPALLDPTPILIGLPGVIALADGWRLHSDRLAADADLAAIFADPLCGVLRVPSNAVFSLRTRHIADRFEPGGMSGASQKLSDTLINMKVPAMWRDRVPLLTIDDRIAWFVAPTAVGLRARVAEPFMVRESRESVWVFRFER